MSSPRIKTPIVRRSAKNARSGVKARAKRFLYLHGKHAQPVGDPNVAAHAGDYPLLFPAVKP